MAHNQRIAPPKSDLHVPAEQMILQSNKNGVILVAANNSTVVPSATNIAQVGNEKKRKTSSLMRRAEHFRSNNLLSQYSIFRTFASTSHSSIHIPSKMAAPLCPNLIN